MSDQTPKPPPGPPPGSATRQDPGPTPKKAKPAAGKSKAEGTSAPPPPPKAPPQCEPPKFNAQQMSYLPQLPDSDDIPLTKEGIRLELQSASAQDWIRALANFQVLGSPVILGGLQSQEQRPLWANRDLSMVPKLFQAITKVRTERGLTWEKILTVRQVLTKEGKVTVATGHDETYVELASPTTIHELVGALFQKLWAHQDFTRFFTIPELTKYENWKLYDMISSTLMAVYNHFCSEAGLTSRMLRRKYPELGIRLVHDAEAKIDPNTGLSERRKPTSVRRTPARGVTSPGQPSGRTMRRTMTTGSPGSLVTKHGAIGATGKINDVHGARTSLMIASLRPAPGQGLPPGHVAEEEAPFPDAGHSPCMSGVSSNTLPSSDHSFLRACRCCLLKVFTAILAVETRTADFTARICIAHCKSAFSQMLTLVTASLLRMRSHDFSYGRLHT